VSVAKIERDNSLVESTCNTIEQLAPNGQYRFDATFVGDPGNHYKISKVTIER
jgi:hypothetical protein